MKKSEVKIGTVYAVKIGGRLCPVLLEAECQYGGWIGLNRITKRRVRIKTAARLRYKYDAELRIDIRKIPEGFTAGAVLPDGSLLMATDERWQIALAKCFRVYTQSPTCDQSLTADIWLGDAEKPYARLVSYKSMVTYAERYLGKACLGSPEQKQEA